MYSTCAGARAGTGVGVGRVAGLEYWLTEYTKNMMHSASNISSRRMSIIGVMLSSRPCGGKLVMSSLCATMQLVESRDIGGKLAMFVIDIVWLDVSSEYRQM